MRHFAVNRPFASVLLAAALIAALALLALALQAPVAGANSDPVLTGSASVSMDEADTTLVGDYNASIPGESEVSFSWSLSGTDAGDFEIERINDQDSKLHFTSTPDYESPADADADNVYHVTLTASHGTQNVSLDVTVTVEDELSEPVVIDGPRFVGVDENTSGVVANFTATDSRGGEITWSMAGEVEDFSLSSDGVLSLLNAADYESSDTYRSIDIYAQSDSGALRDEHAIGVSIVDVDEPPTVTGSDDVTVDEDEVTLVGRYGYHNPEERRDDVANLTDWRLSGVDAAQFEFDTEDGQLHFKKTPDFESPRDRGRDNVYNVTLRIYDGSLYGEKHVAVTVKDTERNPIVVDGPRKLNVNENWTGHVGSFSGRDPAGGVMSWRLNGDHDDKFSISPSGALRLSTPLDFEQPGTQFNTKYFNLSIIVDSDSLSASDTHVVKITIVNTNDPPEVSGETSFDFEEAGSTFVYDFGYSDVDPETTVQWSVAGIDSGDFEIDDEGYLYFRNTPNYEAPADSNGDNVYQVTVRAHDGQAYGTMDVTVTVTDRGAEPLVLDGPRTISVNENRTGHLTTLRVSNFTSEDRPITWSLSGESDKFSISQGGALSVTEALDYETKDTYSVHVHVVNAGDNSRDKHTVTVTVNDINDAPVISGLAEVEVREGVSTLVGAYIATDPDEGDAVTAWHLFGTDRFDFTWDSETGQLHFKEAPDADAPKDANLDNTYHVTLRAFDGTAFGYKQITVTVTTGPPAVNGPEAVNYEENGTGAIATYAATFDDPTWSVTDDSTFSISSSGVLSFQSSPDYEALGGSTTFYTDVTATSGEITASLNVAITVTDVDEPPAITGGTTAWELEENDGYLQVGYYTAQDPEYDEITWSLEGADSDYFTINAAGDLTLAASPDYEAKSSYAVTVKATANGKSDTRAVSVTVTDVDEGPEITGPASVNFDENSTAVVATYSAADPEGASSTLSFGGSDAYAFTFTNGELNFNDAPDYESQNAYYVTFDAEDENGNRTYLDVTIFVEDVDEKPTITQGETDLEIWEDSTYLVVGYYSAHDPESDAIAWSVEGTDAADFTIEDGQLALSERPDYETKSTYSVTVRASANEKSDSRDVTLTVLDVDEAPIISGPAVLDFDENSTAAVGTYTAVDPEGGNVSLSLGGSDADSFTFSDGVLKFKEPPDFENYGYYLVNFSASDDNGNTSSLNVDITIANVDEAPEITDGAAAPSFSEDALSLWVSSYLAEDPEFHEISWSIEGADASAFEIDSFGSLWFKASPDYETKSSYSVTVKATANNKHDTLAVTVEILDADDPPTITGGPSDPSFAENATGTVATYTATDPDGDSISWTVEGADGDSFDISSAGALTFKTPPDHEAQSSYSITVTATANDKTASTSVTVTVTDVNEPTQFTSTDTEFDLTEGISGSFTSISASDPEGETITWSVSGTDSGFFTISGGVLSITNAADFDSPQDANGDNAYELVIEAAAANDATVTMSYTVNIVNQDEAPSITGGGATHSYAENGTAAVATYTATDPEDDAITWSVEGTDADDFSISSSGALSFASSPDFESPSDADANNVYQVTVKASANGLSGTLAVTVTVTDANDPPYFRAENSQTERVTLEGYGKVSINLGIYAASDREWNPITFTLSGADADSFIMNQPLVAGNTRYFTLTLRSYVDLDYEDPKDADADGVYEVTIRAADATGYRELHVTVTVQDVDEAPTIDGPSAVSFTENATGAVASYSATDPEGETTTLTLGGADAGSFNFTGGALSFKSAPDYESRSAYYLTFTASDGALEHSLDVTITIDNVVEANEMTLAGSESLSVAENVSDLALETYTATDPSNGTITWSLEGVDRDDFSISDGVLSFNASPNYEAPTDADGDNVYRVGVEASAGSKSVRRDITVTVSGVDEAPVLVSGPATLSWPENLWGPLATFKFVDPEGDDIYVTLEGPDANLFYTQDDHDEEYNYLGEFLDVNVALDYESPTDANGDNVYELTLRGTANGKSVKHDVKITATNVVEAGEITLTGSGTLSIAENATTLSLATYTATDPDGESISWSLLGADKDAFSISSAGALSLNASPDYETQASYAVTVKATAGSKSTYVVVTLNVTDVNEAPTITGEAAVNFEENSTDEVATYSAEDPEGATPTLTLGGTDAASFSLTDGVLAFNAAPDHETKSSYSVTITATDDDNNSATLDVTITIDNVDEGPTITEGGASHDYAENGTAAVATYTATDPEGDEIEWTLEGDDAGDFSISTDGALSFASSPNYESPTDADTDNEYEVTVKATANGKSATLAVTVTVTDDAEALTLSGSGTMSIEENSSSLTLATYTAEDPEGGAVVWTLEGADKDMFTLTAGVLTLKAAPDYETKSSYTVTVKASAGEKQATKSVTITVSNVDEAPTITEGSATPSFPENGTGTVETYSATDPEGDAISWSVEGTDAASFEISSAGALTFKTAPDHEAKSSYSITVKATANGKHGTKAVTVSVSNVDEGPTITGGSASPSFAENGTGTVETYVATDPEDNTIVWSVEGVDAASFDISSAGSLTFKTAPDHETKSSYSITVKATANGKHDTQAVTVTVSNVDEGPTITGGSATPSFAENGTGTVATYSATDPEDDTISWSVEGADAASFEISSSRALTFKTAPDHETQSSYTITVKATANGKHATQAVTVTVTNVDEGPTVTGGSASPSFAENGTGTVETYVASDPEDDTIVWSVEGTDAASFEISSAGALTFKTAPDHEAKSSYSLTVKATANGKHSTQNVTVTVSNVDEAPTITEGSASPSFAENGTGTVATYAATDPEDDTIAWSVEGPDGAAFNISSAGALTFKTAPDHEAKSSYAITVKATANGKHGTKAVTVSVSNVDEGPTITEGSAGPSFAENGSGTVETYAATDPEDDTISWSVEGIDAASFIISSAGALTFKTAPDHETKSSYTFTVKASANGKHDTQNVTVTVSNVDEAPTITGGSATPSFAENGAGTVATYAATDPEGDVISWSVEGADAASFEISSAGALTFETAPDHEAKSSYSITVKASANGKYATQAVTVTVSNVDEAPTIATGGASHSYAENGTAAVATYTATDPEGDAIIWSLEGTDAGDFSISSSGVLSFVSSPDYELPADADTDNQYQLTVKATANGKFTTLAVTVTVNNEAEALSLTGSDTLSIAENSTSLALATYTAEDPDGGSISWSLEGSDRDMFTLVAGALSLKASPDYEAKSSYTVTVKASVGEKHATKTVTVSVSNVDEGPTITGGSATPSFAENGTGAVETYAATDPEGDTIVWSVEGTDAASFNISSAGALTFKTAPDHETKRSYSLTVKATANGKHATEALTVTVSDVDEAPTITEGSASPSFAENGAGTVATYVASDPEGDEIVWSVEGVNAASFEISSGGTLTFKSAPDRETKSSYSITIKATANGKHGTKAVTVTVTNVDEGPTITGGSASLSFAENGTGTVETYEASDPENDAIDWSIEGVDATSFDISSGGALTFKTAPDHETKSSYSLTVKATANGKHATEAVTVTVSDVDEAPTITEGSASPSFAENGTGTVATYAATDPEGDVISWSVEGADAASFEISSAGALTFKTAPDRESKASYSITVKASANDQHGTKAVTVTVTNVDEGPTITGGSASPSFAENGTGTVETYSATDPESDVITWSVEGTDASSFDISSTGVLRFRTAPDHETKTSYSITVKASANGKHDSEAVTVTVSNVDEAPSITEGPASPSFAENGTGTVATYVASDPEGDAVEWSVEGPDGASFEINSAGALTFKTAPDRESKASYSITIKATANSKHGTKAVTVNVTNVDEGPTITGGSALPSFAENGTGTVETYVATDPESDTISWSVEGTDAASFNIAAGALTFRAAPDYETKTSYSITVKASANGKHDSETVTVTVTNVDEGPTITDGSATPSFAENGTGTVETYAATDPEGDAVEWSVEGVDGGSFEISSVGALTFRTAPDREAKSSYSITIKATANGKHGTMAVTVTVTNVDEGPTITAGSAVQSFAENGTGSVATYSATDPENDPVDWSVEGVDAASFSISSAGALTFNTAPDHEAKSSYAITVKASANGKHATMAVTVAVTDVDEAPTITGLAAVSFEENSTAAVGTYTAQDPEGAATTLTVGGADAASFAFSNGVLSFKSAPDYESKNSYAVTFTASDQTSNTATRNVTITIDNVDEGPTLTAGPASPSFAENGTGTVARYSATDPESDPISWSVEGTDAASFNISSAGALTFTSAPDHETKSSYAITVTASANGRQATMAVSVAVTNVDEAPTITGGGASHRYAENGTSAIAAYTATDPEGDAIDWSVEGTDAPSFNISGSGALSFKSPPDYETKRSYSVTVKATANGKSDTLIVTIAITDVAERTVPDQPTGLSVSQVSLGSLQLSVRFNRVDDTDSYQVRWRRADAIELNDGITQTATPGTGALSVQITVDAYASWVIQVEACNELGCSGSASETLSVITALESDRIVLKALRDSTTAASPLNWSDDVPLSQWEGVRLFGNRVTEIRLDHRGLSGTIPAALGKLTQLVTLTLQHNQLTGGIPSELGNLSELENLSFWNNQLTGGIPKELGNLTYLSWLGLEGNNLTGSIPKELGNLANLWNLTLSDNNLSGDVPKELGNLFLETLYLDGNSLTGCLPAVLALLPDTDIHLLGLPYCEE